MRPISLFGRVDGNRRRREFVGTEGAGKKRMGANRRFINLISISFSPLPPCFSTRRRKTKSGKLRRNASNTKRGSKSLRFEGCCCCCSCRCRDDARGARGERERDGARGETKTKTEEKRKSTKERSGRARERRSQGLSRKATGVRETGTCLAGRKGSGGGNGRRETGEESKATAR